MSKSNILADATVVVEIDSLKPYRKNPRVGNIDAIAESLQQNGQFRPIVAQRSTGEILGGNHTWKAAKSLGWKDIAVVYVDVDDNAAKRIVLADNRTNDLASYDTAILQDIIAGLPDTKGTGYDDAAVRTLMAGMQDRDKELVESVIRPPAHVDFEGSEEGEWDLGSAIKQNEKYRDERGKTDGIIPELGSGATNLEDLRVAESIAMIQMQLERFENTFWPSSNYWGVPDLLPNMLLDELPTKLDTWGGQDATPDDGETTWLWNAGLAATKGMPWDRVITTFFTYDTKFDSWFEQPAFQVARMVHNGCKRAIVPDTSFWIEETRFHHLGAQYRAMWLARFMQEAGVKIIPRFMWCDLESIKVGTLGIPKAPPIAAVCFQALDKKESDAAMTPEGLRMFVKEIQPETLLVYGGGTAKKITEQAVLPKSLHVVHIDNYAQKRRGVVFDNPTGKALVDKAARKRLKEIKEAEKEELAEAE